MFNPSSLPGQFYVPPENFPVDLWNSIGPPPFIPGLLPKKVEEFSVVMSAHMGACASGLSMAALTVMGTAIPDRIKLQPKRHDPYWLESARLWTMLIGPPSSKKSPIISAAIRPLAKMDTSFVREWQKSHASWSALSKDERAFLPEPLQRRLRIEDTTVEAAQEVLKGSIDGVLCAQDELSGWFGAMEKYGAAKGAMADRAFWLRSFSGGEFALNRVGRGVTLIDNLSISLLGGIQPEPIRKIAAEAADDGLLQRMFPITLSPGTCGRDSPLPPVQSEYDCTISMLPHCVLQNGYLRFDEDAQILREKLEHDHVALMNAEVVSRQFSSHVGKLDGLFARLCVIWHVVENCHNILIPNVVRYDTAYRVSQFMQKFLLPHAACFYSSLGLGDDHDRLKAVAHQILAHKLDKVTVRDVQRGTRALRKLTNVDVLPVLQQLVALNWLYESPGPRATSDPVFVVNPQVHNLFAEKASAEQTKREMARKVMQEHFNSFRQSGPGRSF